MEILIASTETTEGEQAKINWGEDEFDSED